MHWDATKQTNIVWSAEIPGLSVSSPVVWGDRVFVATAISSDPKQTLRTGLFGDTDSVNDSSPHQWKLLALDKKTGKILWEQTARQGAPKTKRDPKSPPGAHRQSWRARTTWNLSLTARRLSAVTTRTPAGSCGRWAQIPRWSALLRFRPTA